MKMEQKKYSKAFGSSSIFEDGAICKNIRNNYPAAVTISSASGEIYDTQVNDDAILLIAVCFEKTKSKTAIVHIDDLKNSVEAGRFLAAYGEIPPSPDFMKFELHNQTMTVTTFLENE